MVSARFCEIYFILQVLKTCIPLIYFRSSLPCGEPSVSVSMLEDELLRFRLQGPLAHPVLLDALQVTTVTPDTSTTKDQPVDESSSYWWEKYFKVL